MTPEGRGRLEHDEGGHQLKMYPDSRGIPTISVGFNLRDRAISHRVSEMMYEDAIADTERDVARYAPRLLELDPVRRDTLASIAYNMGIGNLLDKNPKMIAAVLRGDWNAAHDELLDGVYKTQVGARAFRYADQLRTGEWSR